MMYSNIPLGTNNPGCIVILVDQSWFMNEEGQTGTKADCAAKIINNYIAELVLSCRVGEAIKDRCHISVISYGDQLKCIAEGMISKVADLAEVRRIKDFILDPTGKRVEVEIEMPIWLEPQAHKAAPMYEAFDHACEIVEQWISNHPDGFPPVVINITGRIPAYPELTKYAAEKVMELCTTDGNVLVFNVYISGCDREIIFPNNTGQLDGDEASEFLFNISSILPQNLFHFLENYAVFPKSYARCLAVNSLTQISWLLYFRSRSVSRTPNMLKLNVKSFIIHKYGATMTDCEDAYAQNEEASRYAIADGVALSFMPKPWAEFLVKHFCDTTALSLTEENWKKWLLPIQEEWYRFVEERVRILNRFFLTYRFNKAESAAATFIGFEIDKDNHKWKAIIIGDSCLFHLHDSVFESYLIENSTDFTNFPNVFMSFEKDNYRSPRLIIGDIKAGDTFILTTDALAKWILVHKETGKLETACAILKAIETGAQFYEFVETARASEGICLANDDVTLIRISVSL